MHASALCYGFCLSWENDILILYIGMRKVLEEEGGSDAVPENDDRHSGRSDNADRMRQAVGKTTGQSGLL